MSDQDLISDLVREMLLVSTNVGPSSVSGKGLFSTNKIPQGTIVRHHEPKLDKIYQKDYPQTLGIRDREKFEKHASFDGNVWTLSGDDAIYMNHSDSPNLALAQGSGRPSTRDLIAVRDISPGEELTICDVVNKN